MIFKHTYQLGLEDVGIDGKAANRTILAIMEDVAGLHSSSVGFGLLDIEKSGMAWVLLNWHVKILKRPVYMEQVECHTWAREADRICAYRDFEMYNQKGELLAIGASRWLIMNLQRRRPVRIDQESISLYQPELNRHVFEDHVKDLIPVPAFDYTQQYQILRRDMDVNGHMHNLSYLDAAYEMMPLEIYKNKEFNEISLTFKKEIREGDLVTASYKQLSETGCQIVFTSEAQVNAVVELFE